MQAALTMLASGAVIAAKASKNTHDASLRQVLALASMPNITTGISHGSTISPKIAPLLRKPICSALAAIMSALTPALANKSAATTCHACISGNGRSSNAAPTMIASGIVEKTKLISHFSSISHSSATGSMG